MQRTQICPIVFADIVASLKITDDRLKLHLNTLLHRLLDEIKARFQVLIAKHTGDGFFIGVDATEMAEVALSVKDRFRTTDWRRSGFPESMAIRIGVDLQKVTLVEEGGVVVDVASSGIDRAARIEPVVEPNQVWCSDHYFAQLRREHVRNIAGTSIGRRQLAKGEHEISPQLRDAEGQYDETFLWRDFFRSFCVDRILGRGTPPTRFRTAHPASADRLPLGKCGTPKDGGSNEGANHRGNDGRHVQRRGNRRQPGPADDEHGP